jgi:peptide/nickel transport system substrate-binding protein
VTLTLRDGVRWHDGRPLSSADVVFTLRYVAAHYQPRFTPQLDNVARVRASGRLGVTIDLRRPSLGFDDQPLADVPILPKHLWAGLPAGQVAPRGLAVGSGPYRLVSARPKQGYVLRANRDYVLGAPRVDEIRVPIIGDAQRTYRALRERRLDMIPLSLPERVSSDLDAALGISLREGPSYSGTALMLNLRRAPFHRPAARRAVAAALNLQRIVRNVRPATPADEGFIHPSSRWAAGVRLQGFDARVAATARDELGPAPLRVLAPMNDPSRSEAGRQVVLALRRAGARAELVRLTRARLDRALGLDGSPPDFDAAIDSTPPLASYDPDYLTRMFGSDRRAAPLNVTGYRSAAFDALARRVASAPDIPARRHATRAELDLLAHDLPAIPLYFSQGVFAERPSIYHGWLFVTGTGILDKRSFLPSGRIAGNPDAVSAVVDTGSRSWIDWLDEISLAVLAIIAILAATALVQRRFRRG